MSKRKVEEIDAALEPPASSKEFTSLVSKYSYAVSLDEEDTKPSTSSPVTPPTTPKKKKPSLVRPKNPGYAPPSAYSHLPTPDLDCLAENLILLFIGLNPGLS
jgi:hypothetical protein